MKKTTADRLKEVMEERRLRQADIVAMCQPYCEEYRVKLGKSDLSQYVSGRVVPGQSKLFILARALNVNEAWMMGYDVDPSRDDTPIEETPLFQRMMEETAEQPAVPEWYNELSEEDKNLVQLIMRLPPSQKKILIDLAESWKPQQSEETHGAGQQ
ncbi:MAG: transcriptional regulator [Oscillospiraceae bacterium]|nr:transcriptional regulator [Oscillospiraceae bacterium]